MVGRRQTLTFALAGLAAALLLTGCGGRKGATVVHFWALGREGEVVRHLVPAFEALHPGVRIDIQQIPFTAAHEKLLTAFVGRTTPDAAQIGNTWIPEFVALGALAPLDGRIETARDIDPKDYFPGIWDTNVISGKVWGVPWYVDTRVIFYRTDLVAGEPWPPRSWAEWRKVMIDIRKRGGRDHYAILLPLDEYTQPVILALETGSKLLSDGGRYGSFETPAFRRAMSFYVSLFADDLAAPVDRTDLGNLYQGFARGAFAMVITGPWNLGEFERRLPLALKDRWATAPMPPPDPGMKYPGVSLAGGSSLVLFRHAHDSEAAWQWIEYLSASERQAEFYKLSGDLPARRSAWERTDLAHDEQASAFRVQLENVVTTPKVPEWEQIANRIAEAADQVVRGGRSLDGSLASLTRDVDRMLEKRRWMLDHKAGGER